MTETFQPLEAVPEASRRYPDDPHGHLEELRTEPIELLQRVRDECGDVGRFRLVDRDIVLVSGAEVNETFFRAPDEVLDQGEAYPFMTPIFGKGVVFDASPERRKEMLRNQSLRGEQMRGHASTIEHEVRRMVADWGDEGEHLCVRHTSKTCGLYSGAVTLSAKGTRLNRRGLETRHTVLKVAIQCLANGGPESASANLVAREANVTWGTVQHQFGDVDGLWAAVLDHISARAGALVPALPELASLHARVLAIVEQLWRALDSPGSQAIHNLRHALPRHRAELEADYPRTAAALEAWDAGWADVCEQAFEGITVDKLKLRRVRALLPGAMRGLHSERHLSTYIDLDDARRGLSDAITAYLS